VLAPMAAAQGFGDRGDGTAVDDQSQASVSIAGFAGGAWRTLNSDGRVAVPISSFDTPVFYSIGEIDVETGSQTDMVEVAWWEIVLADRHLLQFVYRTETGKQFVPFGAKENGSLIQAFTYEMGPDGNGVDFRGWVDSAFWTELTISYSYDGGQTVFSDPKIYDPAGTDPWNGADAHHLGLALPGDGVNWMQATYVVEVIPAPASAIALLAPGAMFFRRRR
jgi:hypothetical protein